MPRCTKEQRAHVVHCFCLTCLNTIAIGVRSTLTSTSPHCNVELRIGCTSCLNPVPAMGSSQPYLTWLLFRDCSCIHEQFTKICVRAMSSWNTQKLLTVILCFIKSDNKTTNMDKEKILKKDTQVSKINTKIRKDKREEGREERRDGSLTTCLRQFHPEKVQDGWLSQPVLLTMHKAANQQCETTASAP